jgi:hypothetical protein
MGYYNLNLTIIYYAVSHLRSLQSYTPIFHSWRLHIFTLQINIQFTRYIFFTYKLSVMVSYQEPTRRTPSYTLSRTDSANSLLKNWTKHANRFTYIARNSATKTEPVNIVASGHVMSWCLAMGSQRVLLRDVSMFTTVLPWKQEWSSATQYGPVFNLPRLKTARSKHHFPYCCEHVYRLLCLYDCCMV